MVFWQPSCEPLGCHAIILTPGERGLLGRKSICILPIFPRAAEFLGNSHALNPSLTYRALLPSVHFLQMWRRGRHYSQNLIQYGASCCRLATDSSRFCQLPHCQHQTALCPRWLFKHHAGHPHKARCSSRTVQGMVPSITSIRQQARLCPLFACVCVCVCVCRGGSHFNVLWRAV